MQKFLPKNFQSWKNMIAGDVSIRQTLQAIEPFNGDREAWFFSVARKTGLPKSRVKSLFYNRQCRLWADELTNIHQAISGHHKEAVRLLERQGELSNETVNELKHLFSEFLEAYRRPDSH